MSHLSLGHETSFFVDSLGFEDSQEKFGKDKLRILFKFTNDNNPFDQAIITPQSVLDGFSKVGGALIIIKILNFILVNRNKKSFERSL